MGVYVLLIRATLHVEGSIFFVVTEAFLFNRRAIPLQLASYVLGLFVGSSEMFMTECYLMFRGFLAEGI